MVEKKFAKYVTEIPFHKTPAGPLFGVGAKELGGLKLHVIYACGYNTGITGMSRKPHVHKYDEAVFFIGVGHRGPRGLHPNCVRRRVTAARSCRGRHRLPERVRLARR